MPFLRWLALLAVLSTLNLPLSTAHAQGTAFTYQGRLNNGGSPAGGTFNLQFTLFTTNNGGTAVAAPVTANGVVITNGLFTVVIDLGAGVWNSQTNWLQIGVETNGAASFTTLAPRQELTPAPYAIFAGSAGGLPGLVLQQNTNGAPNVIGGSPVNFVAPGVIGATIGGGGVTNYFGIAYTNSAASDFDTIGGGAMNTILGNGTSGGAVIGGGENNTIQAQCGYATISGGYGNAIQGYDSFDSSIGGGYENIIEPSADDSVIGGGQNNVIGIAGGDSTIGGGNGNSIQKGAFESFIGGGQNNHIQTNSTWAALGGGLGNMVQSNSSIAFIGGGENNVVGSGTICSTIGGGNGNTNSGNYATVGGGFFNTASGNSTTVPGGTLNLAAGTYSLAAGQQAQALYPGDFVWADSQNVPFASTGNDQFLIRAQGGVGINTSNPNGAALSVNGGYMRLNDNVMYLRSSTDENHGLGWFSSGSFAGGNPDGPVLFGCGGGTLGTACSSQKIALVWTQSGDVGIGTNNPTHLLQVGNAYCDGNTWSPASDRNLKGGFEAVDAKDILAKVAALPLTRWHYKEEATVPHIGPVAQDFHAAFGVGEDDRHIADVDEGGVALAAIQGLNQKMDELKTALNRRVAENAELKQENQLLEKRLEVLEAVIFKQKSN